MPTITKAFISKLQDKIPESDTFYRDDVLRGFGVKHTKGGKLIFFAEGRVRGGKTRRVTIGEYPFIGLDYARKQAMEVLSEMHKGIDPIERKAQKASEEARDKAMSVTMSEVMELFLKHRKLKPRTIRDYEQTINRWFSDWLNEPISKITRYMVETRFDEIQSKTEFRRNAQHRGKASASKAMRILSAICSYAMAHEVGDGVYLLEKNPVQVLSDKRVDRTLSPRKTYIPLNSVPGYLQAVKELCSPVVADVISLLLFTGLRLNEATGLKWENVDLTTKLFTIPDTKNGSTLTHPMSEQVYEIFVLRSKARSVGNKLDRGREHSDCGVWVFPSTRTTDGTKHITDFRKSLKPVIEKTGIDVTPHDLRRTFATAASSCGLDYLTLKRLMNHKHSDITERYVITAAEQLRGPMQLVANSYAIL